MDIIIILRLIFKPYTKKQKGPVKKYDSQKHIQWTLDPARSCLVPGSIVAKNQVATSASFIILKPFLKLVKQLLLIAT